MKLTCPSCGAEYPIEAGLLEDDGKRLAAVLGEMEPILARAAIAYLRLFKPTKTALRTVRAIKILHELLTLVRAGSVCRDERGGIHRPAPTAAWVAGIDQMLQAPGRLQLPISNHNYLRQVVFGVADAADAKAEKQREQDIRARPRAPAPADPRQQLTDHLNWLADQLARGFMTQADHDSQVAETRARHGGSQ